jgi:putative transposase
MDGLFEFEHAITGEEDPRHVGFPARHLFERLAIGLARQYGRYGYRKIAELLRSSAGWVVNDTRVERIWRRGGLKVPAKQPKRGRLWLADGSCIRLRAERPNHVWSYDFVEDRTHEGKKYRMLNIIDEFTHLAIRIDRKLKSIDVIDVLSDLFILRGVPEHIRSDNGPEFVAKAVQEWITAVGAKTAYITPGSPWENGFIESFNARLRDEFDGEIFYSLRRGQDRNRKLAASLQRREAPWIARLQAASARGLRAGSGRAGSFAIPASYAARAGLEAVNALTFEVDPSVGADQLPGCPTAPCARR